MSKLIDFNRVIADEILYEGTSFLSYGYGIVSQLVTKDKDISIAAKGLYSYLVSCAGNDRQTYPSQKTICNDLGIKKLTTLRNYLDELQSKGYIKIIKTQIDNLRYRNVYLIAVDTRSQLLWMQEYKEEKAKKLKSKSDSKKSSTCSEVKDPNKINKIYNNSIDKSSIAETTDDCKVENENLLNNGEEKSDCDGYVNYHEIAYARCLLEIPEFEIMTTAQQDFHLGLMLKRISRGE